MLAREGASVGVNYCPDSEQAALANEVVDHVRELGGKAVALPADVADASATRGAVTTLIAA
jgi:NAD(P)-dependent dehydrogenase (short-subunit alcohol dehydrogenase family)